MLARKNSSLVAAPSSAKAACGATSVAALNAAVVPVAVGADTAGELRGAGTKALKRAPQLSRTAPVNISERAMSLELLPVKGVGPFLLVPA